MHTRRHVHHVQHHARACAGAGYRLPCGARPTGLLQVALLKAQYLDVIRSRDRAAPTAHDRSSAGGGALQHDFETSGSPASSGTPHADDHYAPQLRPAPVPGVVADAGSAGSQAVISGTVEGELC